MSENEGPRQCLAMSAVLFWTYLDREQVAQKIYCLKVEAQRSSLISVCKISWVKLGHTWLDCSSSDKTAIKVSPR